MTYDVGHRTFDVARQGLALERSKILGVRACDDPGHKVGTDIMLLSTHELVERSPSDEEAESFFEMPYEFSSLGRTPIVDARVCVGFTFTRREDDKPTAESFSKEISLGNFKADGDAHVKVWVAPDLLDEVTVEWVADSATHSVESESEGANQGEHRSPLEFHPFGRKRPEFRGLVVYNRIEDLQMPPRAPIPVPRPVTPTTL